MSYSTGYLQIILAMLIWGSVGIFVRLSDQPSTTIVFFRVFFAFLIGTLYLSWQRQAFDFKGNLRLAIVSGVIISVNWLFFFKAVQTTTISNVVLIYNMAPIISVIWARLFLGERLERRAVLALMVSLVGVALIMSSYQISFEGQDFIGIVFALTSALFYSLVSIFGKHLSSLPPTLLITIQTGISSFVFLPFVLMNPPELNVNSVLTMGIIGIVHTSVALALYYSGLKTVKVQHVSTFTYLDMGSAIVYAYLIYGETPSLQSAVGGIIIFISSLMILTKASEVKKSSCSPEVSGTNYS